MHATYPCPNPVCTHSFASTAIKGAAKLVCPKCGTVFHFATSSTEIARPNAGKKTIPPPSSTAAAPPPPPPPQVPIARPIASPNVPLAVPVQSPPAAAHLDFSSTADVVVPRAKRLAKPKAKRHGARWVVFAVAGLFGLALAVWAGMWLKHFFKKAQIEDDPAFVAEKYNARFAMPGKAWQRDKDIQMKLHVHIGMKSTESNNYLGILFRDYGTRSPSDAEMLDEVLGKLKTYFQGLEWEIKPRDDEVRLAGQPARVLEFQGDTVDSVTMNGECYAMTYRGQGYWFFTWAPLGDLQETGEAIRADWAKLRQGLATLNQRGGWKEKPRETLPFVGKQAKYRLAYVKGLWTLERPEEDDGPLDLLLRGHEPDPERKPLAGKDAVFQVLVLPKQADLKAATAVALDFVQQREKKLYEQMKMEAIKDKNGVVNRDADIGKEPGHLSKWRMKCTEDLERFLIVAVVNRPEGAIVLFGDCLWERHDFWDEEFTALLGSFKARAR